MLKKALLMVLTVTLLATSLHTSPANAAITLRVGMEDPLESDMGALAKRFKEIVEQLSGGELQIELFPNSALGDGTEMVQNARTGTLDMALIGTGQAIPFVSEIGVLILPYVIESHYDAVKATTGGLNKWLNDVCIKKGGFRILGWTYSNFRHFTNSKRPVTCLEDLKGLKVRTNPNKLMIGIWEAFGAVPVPMGWAETFTALQQGVVDGQDNPYIVNYTVKFHEIQKYVTELHYNYSLQPLVIGEKVFKGLSPEHQAILERAGMEAQMYCLCFQMLESEKAKQKLLENGMQLTVLKDESEWMEKGKAIWPQFYDFVGGKEALDTALKLMGK